MKSNKVADYLGVSIEYFYEDKAGVRELIKKTRETDDYIAYEYTDPNNRDEIVNVCEIKKNGMVVQRIFCKRKKTIGERYWYLPIVLSLVGICTITVRLLLL